MTDIMGGDALAIAFCLQSEFGIEVDIRECVEEHGRPRDPSSEESSGLDFRVRILVDWIEERIRERDGDVPDDLSPRLRFHVAECPGVDTEEVVPDAWLHRDLGMD